MARLRDGYGEDDFGLIGGPDIQGDFDGGGVPQQAPVDSLPIDIDGPGPAPIPEQPSGPGGNTERPREIPGPGTDTPNRPEGPSPRSPESPREPTGSTQPAPDVDSSTEHAPPRPREPQPVSAQPPQAFTPLQQLSDPLSMVTPRDPGAQNAALRAPAIGAPTAGMAPDMPNTPSPISMRPPAPFASSPFQVGAAGPNQLFGKAGGLLAGGLGVPGAGDDFETDNIIDELIRTLTGGR